MSGNFLPAKARYYKPGSMIRTNKPRVSANYQLLPSDSGASADTAGICVTLPLITPQMQGEIYCVRNSSSGEISVCATPNDKIDAGAGLVTTYVIPPGDSEDFDIQTTDNIWNVR